MRSKISGLVKAIREQPGQVTIGLSADSARGEWAPIGAQLFERVK